jgi:hypothetical protein
VNDAPAIGPVLDSVVPQDPGARLENLSRRAWKMIDGVFRTGLIILESGKPVELEPPQLTSIVLAVAKLDPGKPRGKLPGRIGGFTLKETA